MTYRRLKKPVIYAAYVVGFVLILSSILLIRNQVLKEDDNTKYVNKTIFEEVIPVVATPEETVTYEQIINPYNDSTVKITRNFYDYKANEKDQINSILNYEGTYIPSTGLTYKGENSFDVVSILSGTVVSVKDDELLGKVVEINHDNGITSIYQSLKDVTVNQNDVISQGQVIGKSGNSNIDKTSGEHLYFELIINNQTVNPSNYFGKPINEI